MTEYKVLQSAKAQLESQLNELATKGWRVVGMSSIGLPQSQDVVVILEKH